MRRFVSILLLLTGTAALAGCGRAQTSGTPLVTVAGTDVSTDAFRTQYTDYLLRVGLRDTPRLRDGFLQRLITTALVVREARDAGIEREEAYRFYEEKARRKLLLEAFADRVLFDTIRVADEELAEMFVRINTQVKARHLYARTRAEADTLAARLRRGESFEALAEEVFADTALARHGGSVGYFTFDEMDPAFEDAAFSLRVGERSEPVRTAYGYSIIEVEDRFTKPILTETEFAQKKDRLAAYVLRRKRAEARSAYVRRLAAELDATFHEPAFTRLADQAGGRAAPADAETRAAWMAEPLVTFGPEGERRTWTVADFRVRAQYTSEARLAEIDTPEETADFVRGLVVREVMLERARAAGLGELPEYKDALRRVMDEWVWERAFERITAGTTVPEDTLRAHYAAHRAAFMIPEKVRVWEILVGTKAEAEALKARLGAETFEALARVHSTRPGADATGGDLGFVTPDQLGVLAGPVFDAREGAMLGPLEVAGRYVLLKVGARQPARQASFEEARPEIERRLRERFERRHFRAHADALRERYEVVLHKKAAAAVANAFEAKKTSF
ncbi:peptidylprolyl isomerase [Rhodocaloribacter sp.]